MNSTSIASLATSTQPRLIYNDTTGRYVVIPPDNNGTAAIPVGVSALTPAGRLVPLILLTGESNSVGVANNTDPLPSEVDIRPAVQILNASNLQFEDLNIGTNNSHGWYNTATSTWSNMNDRHGMELALANSVEEGLWMDDTVYLVKSGQGGSTISQWGTGGLFWPKFVERYTAAITALNALDKLPLPIIWYSQGVNDMGASTAPATWKAATIAHFAKIRKLVGFAPIIMTKFDPSLHANAPGINAAIDQISDEIPLVFAINTVDAKRIAAGDAHWDYEGMLTVGRKMIDVSINRIGERYRYLANILRYAGSDDLPEAPVVPFTELVANGDFAAGSFTGSLCEYPPNWNANNNHGFAYIAEVESPVQTFTPDGENGNIFNFNGGNRAADCVIYQDITTEANKFYRLDFWVRTPSATQKLNVQVLNDSTPITSMTIDWNDGAKKIWRRQIIDFKATSATTRIRLADASTATANVDTWLAKVSCYLKP